MRHLDRLGIPVHKAFAAIIGQIVHELGQIEKELFLSGGTYRIRARAGGSFPGIIGFQDHDFLVEMSGQVIEVRLHGCQGVVDRRVVTQAHDFVIGDAGLRSQGIEEPLGQTGLTGVVDMDGHGNARAWVLRVADAGNSGIDELSEICPIG